jgi:hypothetical protein
MVSDYMIGLSNDKYNVNFFYSPVGFKMARCSYCDKWFGVVGYDNENDITDIHDVENTNYCPYCGEEMM